MGECKRENNTANGFRIVFLHWKISTLSISCDENVLKLSQTAYVCTRAHIVHHFYAQEFSGCNGPVKISTSIYSLNSRATHDRDIPIRQRCLLKQSIVRIWPVDYIERLCVINCLSEGGQTKRQELLLS